MGGSRATTTLFLRLHTLQKGEWKPQKRTKAGLIHAARRIEFIVRGYLWPFH